MHPVTMYLTRDFHVHALLRASDGPYPIVLQWKGVESSTFVASLRGVRSAALLPGTEIASLLNINSVGVPHAPYVAGAGVAGLT